MKKKYIYAIVSVFVLAAVSLVIYVQQTAFQPTPKGFYQWTGRPSCGSAWCSWADTGRIYSPSAEINTGKNVFKFDARVSNIEKVRSHCAITPEDAANLCSAAYRYMSTFTQTGIDTATRCLIGDCYNSIWNGAGYDVVKGVHLDGNLYDSDIAGNINYKCYQELDVYRNNAKIDTLRSSDPIKTKTYYDDGSICEGVCSLLKSGVVAFSAQESFWYYPTCSAFANQYSLVLPNNSYDVTASSPRTSYFQGQAISINVIVKNLLGVVSQGVLSVNYKVPTIIGEATKTEQKAVTIAAGTNTFTYNIPTTEPVRILKVQPILEINFPTSYFKGVNYDFGEGITAVSSKPSLKLGEVVGIEQNVMIMPKPIYYVKGSEACLAGYSISKDGTYCISDDIKNLSCVQIGCPQNYVCESSGGCSQPIYVSQKCKSDTECIQMTGQQTTKCSIDTGYCYDRIVYEKVVGCSVDSDCMVDCEGRTSSCTNNKCVYSGECIYKQCTNTDDCISFNYCQGISHTCKDNKCIPSGRCEADSSANVDNEESFWDLIVKLWGKLIQWLKDIFT